jgi:hypothetical protein
MTTPIKQLFINYYNDAYIMNDKDPSNSRYNEQIKKKFTTEIPSHNYNNVHEAISIIVSGGNRSSLKKYPNFSCDILDTILTIRRKLYTPTISFNGATLDKLYNIFTKYSPENLDYNRYFIEKVFPKDHARHIAIYGMKNETESESDSEDNEQYSENKEENKEEIKETKEQKDAILLEKTLNQDLYRICVALNCPTKIKAFCEKNKYRPTYEHYIACDNNNYNGFSNNPYKQAIEFIDAGIEISFNFVRKLGYMLFYNTYTKTESYNLMEKCIANIDINNLDAIKLILNALMTYESDEIVILLNSLIERKYDIKLLTNYLNSELVRIDYGSQFKNILNAMYILELEIDKVNYSDKIISKGNQYEINNLFANNEFILTDKSLINACKSGKLDLIEKLLNMKIVPTSDCIKALPYDLLNNERLMDLFIMTGMAIDITVYRYLYNFRFFKKYNYVIDENSYLEEHKLNENITAIYDRELHQFRHGFKTINKLSDLVKHIEISNYIPDQYCYDHVFTRGNFMMIKYLEINYNLLPTEISINLLSKNLNYTTEDLNLIKKIYPEIKPGNIKYYQKESKPQLFNKN